MNRGDFKDQDLREVLVDKGPEFADKFNALNFSAIVSKKGFKPIPAHVTLKFNGVANSGVNNFRVTLDLGPYKEEFSHQHSMPYRIVLVNNDLQLPKTKQALKQARQLKPDMVICDMVGREVKAGDMIILSQGYSGILIFATLIEQLYSFDNRCLVKSITGDMINIHLRPSNFLVIDNETNLMHVAMTVKLTSPAPREN